MNEIFKILEFDARIRNAKNPAEQEKIREEKQAYIRSLSQTPEAK